MNLTFIDLYDSNDFDEMDYAALEWFGPRIHHILVLLSMCLILQELCLSYHKDPNHRWSNFSQHSEYFLNPSTGSFHSYQSINSTTASARCFHWRFENIHPSMINQPFLFGIGHDHWFNQLTQYWYAISNSIRVFSDSRLQRSSAFESAACLSMSRHRSSCPWASGISFVYVILQPNVHESR